MLIRRTDYYEVTLHGYFNPFRRNLNYMFKVNPPYLLLQGGGEFLVDDSIKLFNQQGSYFRNPEHLKCGA